MWILVLVALSGINLYAASLEEAFPGFGGTVNRVYTPTFRDNINDALQARFNQMAEIIREQEASKKREQALQQKLMSMLQNRDSMSYNDWLWIKKHSKEPCLQQEMPTVIDCSTQSIADHNFDQYLSQIKRIMSASQKGVAIFLGSNMLTDLSIRKLVESLTQIGTSKLWCLDVWRNSLSEESKDSLRTLEGVSVFA